MKASEIIALANAGYNAEQISKIAKAAETEPENPKQENPKQENPKQENPKQENPKQENPKQENPQYDDLLGKIEALTKQIQNSAILRSTQPEEETVDDILANIIDPPEFHPKNKD